MDKPIISMQHVSKTYYIYKSNRQRFAREMLGRSAGEGLTALRDINLEIQQGERLAVAGPVGSGRSTLINLLAEVTYPTEGIIHVRKKTCLIRTLKVGFVKELSGRENLRMQGSILGWSRQQIAEKEDEIIDFAQLRDVIDYPLSTYNNIDANRLGFAIQTTFGADIILYDAPFTKGDLEFRQKSMQRLHELCEQGNRTLILVTNDRKLAKRFCGRAIMLEDGKISQEGDVEDVYKIYRKNKKKRGRQDAPATRDVEEERYEVDDVDEFG